MNEFDFSLTHEEIALCAEYDRVSELKSQIAEIEKQIRNLQIQKEMDSAGDSFSHYWAGSITNSIKKSRKQKAK